MHRRSPIRSSTATHRFSRWLRTTTPLDAVLITVVIVLSAGAAASVVMPSLHMRIVAPRLDLVLDTLATVVTLAVAMLGWARFREHGEPMAVFRAAAFLILSIANGLLVVLPITGLERQAGLVLEDPGQAPLYVFTFARLFAAALLVLGGVASIRTKRVDHAPAIVLGSAAAMLLIIALAQAGADRLPDLRVIGTVALQGGAPGGGSLLPTPTPLGATLLVLGAALFMWTAGLSRRLYRRDGRIGDAYLAIGLVVAAFAQIDAAAAPSVYAGLGTSGDVLRLAFGVILLLGIQAETLGAFSRLKLAQEDQARLQVVELQRASLEERTRLSRELHDGLAQDLWLAKLKSGRLAALPHLSDEGRALARELGDAIDAGLVEAHQAVSALRISTEMTGTLCEVMARSVDEFSERYGLRAEFEGPPDLPSLPPRAQAEALRITQEALTNVRRHADATVVLVRAAVENGRLVLVVQDNGRGFDPSGVGRSAFGIASMRERAELIGGEVRIESRPMDGTRISLLVPIGIAVDPVPGGCQ
jgi:signal transduction histidine kinase